ncbi:hypothetical protein NDU88_004123, partial [Pleurodeles waltl]
TSLSPQSHCSPASTIPFPHSGKVMRSFPSGLFIRHVGMCFVMKSWKYLKLQLLNSFGVI